MNAKFRLGALVLVSVNEELRCGMVVASSPVGAPHHIEGWVYNVVHGMNTDWFSEDDLHIDYNMVTMCDELCNL